MNMTSSMCVSMTGRPTPMQVRNNEMRKNYEYYNVAKYLDYASNQPMRDGEEMRDFFDSIKGERNGV